ncbi:hypothetical protein EWM64_g721 [Hericium alpestre]|uniref:Uncharacterized protein n=1 Tax=Hericium alpestre TaxID=135208 RepID=A0A4Z0AAF5_9AGAM|nr:hypothetical protein EWM64_g721 [Hericium alpestre]
MSRYSTTVDNIISDYYETSASAPPQKRTPRMSDADADRLPLSRSITQSTSGTVASSAHLVGGHNHRRSSRGKSFFSGWKWHPNGPDRKDLDREEMAQDQKVVPDVLKPPMKPWHGWRHILFCSCKDSVLNLSLATRMIIDL